MLDSRRNLVQAVLRTQHVIYAPDRPSISELKRLRLWEGRLSEESAFPRQRLRGVIPKSPRRCDVTTPALRRKDQTHEQKRVSIEPANSTPGSRRVAFFLPTLLEDAFQPGVWRAGRKPGYARWPGTRRERTGARATIRLDRWQSDVQVV